MTQLEDEEMRNAVGTPNSAIVVTKGLEDLSDFLYCKNMAYSSTRIL